METLGFLPRFVWQPLQHPKVEHMNEHPNFISVVQVEQNSQGMRNTWHFIIVLSEIRD